jgi:hypothetical protein
MDPIVLHRNDSKPSIYHRVYDQDNLVYLDLTDSGYLVIDKFRAKGGFTVLFTFQCVKVSPSQGLVRLDWPADALKDLDAGLYEIETFASFSSTSGSITAATAASPVSITSATHGLSTGDKVYISGVVGMTDLNNQEFEITVVDANTFTLDGIDGSAYTAWSSGGTWRKFSEVQTANKHYMNGTPYDSSKSLLIRLLEDF